MGPFGFNIYGGYGGMMGRDGGGMMGGYGYGYQQPTVHNTNPAQPHPQHNITSQFTRSMFGGMMGRLGNGSALAESMRGYGYTAPYAYTGTP